jgi:hypothetical protein
LAAGPAGTGYGPIDASPLERQSWDRTRRSHPPRRRPPPSSPSALTLASRTPLRRSDRANACCSAATIEGLGECRPTFVTAKASDPLYPHRPLCASRVALACPRKPRGRACTTPIAPTCIALLPRRRSGLLRPTFVTVKASDTPCTQPGLCASRVPPAHPRRCSACACAPGHAPIGRRCLVPLRRPDRSASAIFCPHIAVPQPPAATRDNLNPWRLTRSSTASGHAPAAQNCPRSRTRLTPWLRRFSGAANAAGASEAGVLKTQTGERKSFAQS